MMISTNSFPQDLGFKHQNYLTAFLLMAGVDDGIKMMALILRSSHTYATPYA
jgi:hypothetical protein